MALDSVDTDPRSSLMSWFSCRTPEINLEYITEEPAGSTSVAGRVATSLCSCSVKSQPSAVV